jgi:OOP family OmpA-OmpF porin
VAAIVTLDRVGPEIIGPRAEIEAVRSMPWRLVNPAVVPRRPVLAAAVLFAAMMAAHAAAATDGTTIAPALPPGMVAVHESVSDSYALPVRPYGEADGMTEPWQGRVVWRSFRGPLPATALAAVEAAAAPIEMQGLGRVLDCADRACGGFDFRLGLSLLDPASMAVSPGNFHQRTLRGTDALGRPVAASLLASRLGGMTHLQVVTVTRPAVPSAQPDAPPRPSPDPPAPREAAPQGTITGLADGLDRDGRAVLEGLAFDTAGEGGAMAAAPVLDDVAALMRARPDLSLVVVGHSDGVGALGPNMRLSKARAEAVVAALVARGVPAGRLTAEGAGWLAPRASNDTEAGRAANRRVEIVRR